MVLTCKAVMSVAAICPFPDTVVYWHSQEHRNTFYTLQFLGSIFSSRDWDILGGSEHFGVGALHTSVFTPLSKPPPSLSLPVELLLMIQSPHRLSPLLESLPNHPNQMCCLPLLGHGEFCNSPLQHFTLKGKKPKIFSMWPFTFVDFCSGAGVLKFSCVSA